MENDVTRQQIPHHRLIRLCGALSVCIAFAALFEWPFAPICLATSGADSISTPSSTALLRIVNGAAVILLLLGGGGGVWLLWRQRRLRFYLDQFKAKETLWKSDQRYHALLENSLQAFAYCELLLDEHNRPADFVHLDVNAAFERMTGLTEVVGKRVSEVIPGFKESCPELLELFGRVVATRRPEKLEINFKPWSRWFSVSAYSTEAGHFAAIFEDLTEHKRSEAQLRLQSSALESAANGIIITDREGIIQWVNAAFTRLTGYAATEAVGRNPRELIKSDHHDQAFYKQMWDTILDGRVWQGEILNRRKDGILFTESQTIAPVRNMHGEISHFIGIKDDITERKRTENALREHEARFRAVVESAVDAVVLADDRGLIIGWNKAARAIFGYTEEEIIGQPLNCLMPERYREAHQNGLARVCSTGETRVIGRTVELHGIHKDGREFPITLSLSSWTTDQRIYFSGFIRDISEYRRLEEQFLQAQKMECVGQLAGGVAHDFNNLLSVILGYSEFAMQKLPKEDPLRADLLQIHNAGNRAAALTRQLLAFSRKQLLRPEVLNLKYLVSEQEKMLHRLIREDIDFKVVSSEDLGCVKIDPGQMEQVIMNLVVNARDAMPTGGRLAIEMKNAELDEAYTDGRMMVESGSYVLLAVSDTGVGMDKATAARIFEPFFTTKERGKGTGLGLATVYGIVKQSGGYIFVYSEEGEGTTFKIYLPRVAEEQESGRQVQNDAPASGIGTILVVEDEESVRELTERILTLVGYTVLPAANGDEALTLMERHREKICLLLTDVILPGIDGPQLAQQLTRMSPTLKVLFMSGYMDDAIVRHGILDEESPFVGKPFTAAELTRMVRRVLVS